MGHETPRWGFGGGSGLCPAWGLGAGSGFARASASGPRNYPGPPRGLVSLETGSFCGCKINAVPRVDNDYVRKRCSPSPGWRSEEVTCKIILKCRVRDLDANTICFISKSYALLETLITVW